MSLIKDVIPAYKIYAGVPANKIGDRSKNVEIYQRYRREK